jgi:hypothetical protein
VKKISFEGQTYDVLDETPTHYVCPPENQNEGYHFITKSKATEIIGVCNEKELTYAFCDDWLIFAKDAEGNLYYVITEMWEEWLDCPDDADQEENAVEKYMLPIAKEKWNTLRWNPAPKE